MKVHTLRLNPGEDLKQALVDFTHTCQIQAGAILTCVGSLQKAVLRLAKQNEHQHYEGAFEIVSLVGTIGFEGVHLHMSIADANGQVIGGHLVDGCEIYTTAEIVIGEISQYRFAREHDESTGYHELKVYRLS